MSRIRRPWQNRRCTFLWKVPETGGSSPGPRGANLVSLSQSRADVGHLGEVCVSSQVRCREGDSGSVALSPPLSKLSATSPEMDAGFQVALGQEEELGGWKPLRRPLARWWRVKGTNFSCKINLMGVLWWLIGVKNLKLSLL